MSLPLWQHQIKAINFAATTPEMALFYEVGTGKTRTTIEILRRKFAAHGAVCKTLILCPKIVCSNWKKQFALYSKVNQKDIIVLKGPAKKRVAQFIANKDKPKIFVTNFEAMEMDELYAEILKWLPEILIVDESHRCKNIKSVRAQRIYDVARLTNYRYILTGTPVLNSAMDLFMQFKILDLGKTFGVNFYTFRGKYFEDENASWSGKQGYFPKWVPRPETYWELSQKIASKSLSVKKSECLDLPPLVRQQVDVEMSPEQERIYRDMERDYIAYVKGLENENRAVVAQLAVTKSLRMQQILSGFVKTDNGDEIPLEKVPRLAALEELLEDLHKEHKIIVWAVHRQNYKAIIKICEKLDLQYAQIHGEIEDKDAQLDLWRNPKTRVLIANQGAGGIGIDLIESDVMIYYSKNFSLEHDLQSEARAHRGGSEIHEKITRIDLCVPGTIDDLINEVLLTKGNIGETILKWAKTQEQEKK